MPFVALYYINQKNTMKNLQPLYQHLGYLYYSIAAADKQITPQEIEQLQDAVKKEWLDFESSTDEFGTDAAHYISIAFEYLTENMPEADEAYQLFEAFYKGNRDVFSHQLKDKVMHTARAIAHAFSGINKAELNKLGELTLLFNN